MSDPFFASEEFRNVDSGAGEADRRQKFFASEEFRDANAFREWLLGNREGDDGAPGATSRAFRLVYSIVQTMSQLRYRAEEEHGDRLRGRANTTEDERRTRHADEEGKDFTHSARSESRELPLPPREIVGKIFGDGRKEAPDAVVSRIARYGVGILSRVVERPRMALRRVRRMTSLGAAQQLDSQCLRWLMRRPGITVRQKAGARQEVLAVVRQESRDLLENRVLKRTLEFCLSYGTRYLQEYGEKFKNSERIGKVRRLRARAHAALRGETLKEVPRLNGNPVPNYVLRYDGLYSRVWEMYAAFARQTVLMEAAWRERADLLREHVLFCLAVAADFEYGDRIPFQTDFWIAPDVGREGRFIRNTTFSRIVVLDGKVFQLIVHEEIHAAFEAGCDAEIRFGDGRSPLKISVAYVPAGKPVAEFLPERREGRFCFAFFEDEAAIPKDRADVHAIEPGNDNEFFYWTADWLKSRMEGRAAR